MRNNSVLEFHTIKSKFSQIGTITEEVSGTKQALFLNFFMKNELMGKIFFYGKPDIDYFRI